MPTQNAHLEVARRNQDLIDHLSKDFDQFPEWITTAAFYRALHLVEAAFAADPLIKHGGDHGKRHRLLKGNKYKAIYRAYRPLWAASVVARYLEDRETSQEFPSFSKYLSVGDVKRLVLDHYLRKIESSVEQLIGKSIRRSDPAP